MTKEKFCKLIQTWIHYQSIMDRAGDVLGINVCETAWDNDINFLFSSHFDEYPKWAQDMITDFIYENCYDMSSRCWISYNPTPMKIWDKDSNLEATIDSLEALYDYIDEHC